MRRRAESPADPTGALDSLCGVYPALSYAVAGYFAALTVLALVAIRVPRLEPAARAGMKVGQGATLLVVLLDGVSLLQGHRVDSQLTHLGYAVAALGLPVILLNRPAGLDQTGEPEDDAQAQPSPQPRAPAPAHLGVLALTAATMVVLVIRLQQTW